MLIINIFWLWNLTFKKWFPLSWFSFSSDKKPYNSQFSNVSLDISMWQRSWFTGLLVIYLSRMFQEFKSACQAAKQKCWFETSLLCSVSFLVLSPQGGASGIVSCRTQSGTTATFQTFPSDSKTKDKINRCAYFESVHLLNILGVTSARV